MEDENIIKNEKQSSSLAPALGLFGLGLGIIALAVGVMAMVKVGDTAKNMNDKIERAAALALETKKISDRIDSLALQIEEIKSSDKNSKEKLINTVRVKFNEVYTAINETRSVVNANKEAIETLAKRGVRKAQAPAETKVEQKATTEQTADQTAEQSKQDGATKKHVIQSGDTFGKLAKKYGVSVSAIVSANPNANPSRLKVGQEIIIP